MGVVLKPGTGQQLADDGHVRLDGDAAVLTELAGAMDEFDPNFNIVTP